MKNDIITRAYNSAAPDVGTEERIWQRISREADAYPTMQKNTTRRQNNESEARPVTLVAKKERPVLRRFGLSAACVALTVTALAGAWFGYQKWIHAQPQEVLPGASGVSISIPGERVEPEDTGASATSTDVPETTAPSEEEMAQMREDWFRLQAIKVLEQAGVTDLTPEDASVQELPPSYEWERDQIEVSWPGEDEPIRVLFDAKDIVFLRVYGLDWVLSDDAPCSTQEDADALAERLYHSLPVNQEYVMAGCEKYDSNYWTYDFCREVEPGVYSWLECVRISVDPETGTANFIKVFYVPLSTEHEEGQLPLSEEEALRAAGWDSDSVQDWNNKEGLTVKKVVAIRHSTNPGGGVDPEKHSDFSRICWKIEYHEPESEEYIAGGWVKYVDYYTGEIIDYDYFG